MKTTHHNRFYNLLKSPRTLNLQLFAEGDDAGEGGNDNPPADPAGAPPEFKAPQSQSELDSLIGKAVNKALTNAKTQWEQEASQKVAEARTQAEKLAKMSAEERAAEEERQRLAKLDEREQLLNQRELKATAIDILVEKGMPVKLAEVLNYSDENTTKAHLDALSEAFSQAVQDEVDKRLVASAEVPGATGSSKGSDPAVEMGKRLASQTNSQPKNDPYFGKK